MSVLNLFPGQGSQLPGMGRRAVARSAAAAELFDQASDEIGLDLRRLCFGSTLAELTPTEVLQPALTAAALATFLADDGRLPAEEEDRFSGHSVGALAAAAAAGYLTPAEAIRLAALRGRLMSAAPGEGAMMAVVLPRTRDEATLFQTAQDLATDIGVDVGAVNGPTQVVLSGDVTRIVDGATAIRHTTKRLEVSHAFHSRLMLPVQPEWDAALDAVHLREGAGFVGCTDGQLAADADEVREDLRRGLVQPVRWMAVMDATSHCEEIRIYGPGRAIARLARPWSASRRMLTIEEVGAR